MCACVCLYIISSSYIISSLYRAWSHKYAAYDRTRDIIVDAAPDIMHVWMQLHKPKFNCHIHLQLLTVYLSSRERTRSLCAFIKCDGKWKWRGPICSHFPLKSEIKHWNKSKMMPIVLVQQYIDIILTLLLFVYLYNINTKYLIWIWGPLPVEARFKWFGWIGLRTGPERNYMVSSAVLIKQQVLTWWYWQDTTWDWRQLVFLLLRPLPRLFN